MKDKTFREKLGDTLDNLGKRFLICLGCTAVGLLLCIIPLGFLIGVPLAYFGIYGMLSVIPKEKTYLIGGITITSPDGKSIPCALIKQKHYAYMPIIPIVCPFYYFSYKTQYYLMRNVSAKKLEKPMRVHNNILSSGIIEAKALTHTEFKAIAENGRANEFYNEIKTDAENARAQYLSDIAPFVETGLVEEVYYNERISVCCICKKSYVLFHFSRKDGAQCGLSINESLANALKEDDTEIFEAYIENPQLLGLMVTFNDRALERMLNAPELKECVNKEEATEARAEMDKKKKQITREMIVERLRSDLILGKLLWGIFWAFWCLLFVICGIFGGIFGIIGFTVLIGGFTGSLSVSFFKEHFANKKALANGRFTVVKVACTEIVEENSDDGTYYTYKFANGASYGGDKVSCNPGDFYYFVYPEGRNISDVFYPALEYAPAPDIIVTDYI